MQGYTEPDRARRSRSVTGTVALAGTIAASAFGASEIQVAETSYNVVANQGDSVSRTLTLQVPAGSNAAHYSVVAQLDGFPVAAAAAAAPAQLRVAAPQRVNWEAKHASDRLIVSFDDRETVQQGVRFVANANAQRARAEMHRNLGTTLAGRIGLSNSDIVEVPEGTNLRALAARYMQMPGVVHVEPDYVVSVNDFPDDQYFPFGPSSLGAPDDQRLWGLHTAVTDGQQVRSDVRFDYDIDAVEAWHISRGSDDVIVAVIDTGVDYTHRDLAPNMWINTDEIPGNGIDDDNNGYIDDIYGYDFVNNDADPMDDHYHGTHCAGTVGAAGNNGLDVVGVNWNVKIMAMKFLGSGGSGNSSNAALCLDYAVANGATISSNSWGGGGFSNAMFTAIQNANAAGHIFIAAAGNNSRNTDNGTYLPQGYDSPNVVSVASLQPSGGLSGFSNYGVQSVDIAAPGSNIWSTDIGGGLRQLNGTSMATPHVSGVAALLKSVRPDATIEDLKNWLYTPTDDKFELGAFVGSGRLNAWGSLNMALTPWFSMDQREGILSSADGSTQLTIDFETFQIPSGTYTGNIKVLDLSYDDRVAPVTDIPFTYTLTYVQAPPVAFGDSFTVGDGGTTGLTLSAQDPNVEDTLTFTIESLPTDATLVDQTSGLAINSVPYTLAGDSVDFTPAINGVDFLTSFTFSANDGTSDSNIATIDVDVISAAVPPTNLQGGPSGTNRARLTWSPAPAATGYNVQYAEYEDGPWLDANTNGPVSETEFFYTLPWEGEWWFRVSSLRDIAESEYSDPVGVQVNDPYDNPVTATAGPDYIDITFSGGGGYTDVYIQRSTNKYEGWQFYSEFCNGGSNFLRDCNVTPGVTYYYRSVWYDLWDGFYFAYSAPAGATVPLGLQQPQNLEVDFEGDQVINMTWDANPGAYGYVVYRANSISGPYSVIAQVPESEFLDEDLTNYRTYWYKVSEFGQAGESELSNASFGTPYNADQAPPAPNGLFFDEVVDDELTIEWNSIRQISEYRIYRGENGATPTLYATVASNNSPYSQSFSDGGVTPGATYCYRISAVSVNGVEGVQSYDLCATIPDPSQPPAAPTGLFFDEVVDNEATIEWDPVTGVQGYRVYRANDPSGPFASIAYVPSGSGQGVTSYTDTDLAGGTQYCYYVVSISYAGVESSASNTICATLPGQPVNQPPVANPDQFQVYNDAPTTLDVLANDTDPENDALELDDAYLLSGQGTVNIINQNTAIKYTAPAGFEGDVEIEYLIIDEGNNPALGYAYLQVLSPPNTEPSIVDDVATTTVNTPISINVLANDSDEDPGDTLSIASITQPMSGAAAINGSAITYTPNPGFIGIDTFTYAGTDGTDSEIGNVTVTVTSAITMDWGTTTASGAWNTVELDNRYSDMVVVCVVERVNNTNPVVARVRLTPDDSSFELKLQNPGDGASVVSDTVHYIVTQQGAFDENGVKFEAVRYTSNTTARKNAWGNVDRRNYMQSYTNPVVIGQVMSDNDPEWSAFFSRSNNQGNPPSASDLRLGKHVGEDPNTSRASETIGYIVFEQGSGSIAGVPFEAVLGSDNVTGNPRTYNFTQTFNAGSTVMIASQSAMDGGDGSWAVLAAAPGASGASVEVDEDQLRDSERNHTSEQLAYIAFASPGVSAGPGTSGVGIAGIEVPQSPRVLSFEHDALSLEAAIDRGSGVEVSADRRALTLFGERSLTVDLGNAFTINERTILELDMHQPVGSRVTLTFLHHNTAIGSLELLGETEGARTLSLDLADFAIAGDATHVEIASSGKAVTLSGVILADASDTRLAGVRGALIEDAGEPDGSYIINNAANMNELLQSFISRDGTADVRDLEAALQR